MTERNEKARTRRVRIMLVEDHPLTRLGVTRALSNDARFEVCAQAEDVEGAIQEAEKTRPDMIIVDMTLKQGTGIELIAQLRKRGIPAQTLVFTMHDESLFAEDAMRAGARGYVNKKAGIRTLIEALIRVVDGGIYLEPAFMDQVVRRLSQKGAGSTGDSIDALSTREKEVFENLGHGKSVRQIADELGLSPKTIDTYRENIKGKLGAKDSHELMRLAVRWVTQRAGGSSSGGDDAGAGKADVSLDE